MYNQGGGGGGGRGSGRGRSRGGGRSSGGRNNYHNNNNNNNYNNSGGGRGGGGRGDGGSNVAGKAWFRPCKNFTTGGACQNGDNCSFAHIVKLHAVVDASTYVQSNPQQQPQQQNNYNNNYNNRQNQQQMASVSAVAIWENPAGIKIFTGSHDGFWRLWNTTAGQFSKEFESNMRGKVECLAVVNNYLFCGFEAVSRALPDVSVGMVHAWNLQQPSQPPLELQIHPHIMPYAHNQAVTALCIAGEGANAKVVSGARDGSIRVWALGSSSNPAAAAAAPMFTLFQTLVGHARQVTGLVVLGGAGAGGDPDLLWSCGIDGCLRIWKISTGECQHVITRDTQNSATPGSPPPPQIPGGPAAAAGVGHSRAVTAMLSFTSAGTTFLLSSSLDKTIKAWNGTTGACVASEIHDEGVVTMSLATNATGQHQLLLIGLESGNIMCRNLIQTPKASAFQVLFTLSSKYSVAHNAPVKTIAPGPAATFYSGGDDGKLLVCQITGDLGLQ